MPRSAARSRSRPRCGLSSPATSRTRGGSVMRRVGAALLVLAGACMPALLATAAQAQSQAWPTRPVRIVNTFAPGGAADLLARTVAEGLGAAFGQPFYVETRAGAAGAIGVQSVMAM